jgi:hypothetical protein
MIWDQTREHKNHTQALSNRAHQEDHTTSSLIDDEPRNGSKYCVDDHVDSSKEKSQIVGGSDGRLKKDRKIVNNCVVGQRLFIPLLPLWEYALGV